MGIEDDPTLHSKVKSNIDLVTFNPKSKVEQLAAEVILNKAIFATDIILHYGPDRKVNLAQEFLHGAHFIIADNGHLYDILSAKKLGGRRLVGERFSSHYPTSRIETDISFQCSPIISELLIGKAKREGKVITWFQTEGNPMTSLRGVALHTIDLIQYITTGRNVGLYGTSEFTERSGPLTLTEKSEAIHLEHGIEAEKQLIRMKAIQALEAKRSARIAALAEQKGVPTHHPADKESKGAALMRKQREKLLATVAAPAPKAKKGTITTPEADNETYMSSIIRTVRNAYTKFWAQEPTAETKSSGKSESKAAPRR